MTPYVAFKIDHNAHGTMYVRGQRPSDLNWDILYEARGLNDAKSYVRDVKGVKCVPVYGTSGYGIDVNDVWIFSLIMENGMRTKWYAPQRWSDVFRAAKRRCEQSKCRGYLFCDGYMIREVGSTVQLKYGGVEQ